MAIYFLQRIVLFIRRLFKQQQKNNKTGVPARPTDSPKVKTQNPSLMQARCFLFREQVPIGKAYRKREPEIRMLQVNDFTEAFCIFLHLFDLKLLTYHHSAGYFYCIATLPARGGSIEFSNHMEKKDKHVIAVLKMKIPGIDKTIREIKFLSNTKKNRSNGFYKEFKR